MKESRIAQWKQTCRRLSQLFFNLVFAVAPLSIPNSYSVVIRPSGETLFQKESKRRWHSDRPNRWLQMLPPETIRVRELLGIISEEAIGSPPALNAAATLLEDQPMRESLTALIDVLGSIDVLQRHRRAQLLTNQGFDIGSPMPLPAWAQVDFENMYKEAAEAAYALGIGDNMSSDGLHQINSALVRTTRTDAASFVARVTYYHAPAVGGGVDAGNPSAAMRAVQYLRLFGFSDFPKEDRRRMYLDPDYSFGIEVARWAQNHRQFQLETGPPKYGTLYLKPMTTSTSPLGGKEKPALRAKANDEWRTAPDESGQKGINTKSRRIYYWGASFVFLACICIYWVHRRSNPPT